MNTFDDFSDELREISDALSKLYYCLEFFRGQVCSDDRELLAVVMFNIYSAKKLIDDNLWDSHSLIPVEVS